MLTIIAQFKMLVKRKKTKNFAGLGLTQSYLGDIMLVESKGGGKLDKQGERNSFDF